MIDGLTGVQRVFFGWAQVWRTKSRDAEAIRRLAIDPHSPPEFRCNGVVRNIDAFYDAFEVAESDELYLEPAAARAHLELERTERRTAAPMGRPFFVGCVWSYICQSCAPSFWL